MTIWEISILKIINDNQQETSLKKIYPQIPNNIDLTDEHYEIPWGVPEQQNQIRAHVDDLLKKNDVERTKRGVCRITPKGIKNLAID